MLRKKILAFAAVGTMALGLAAGASTADAKHRHHRFHNNGVGIFLGMPFFFDGYRHSNRYAYRSGYDGYDCRWVKVKRKHHKARLVKRCYDDNW